ncbi:MAG: MarR family transcriptional regulator [bacterium]|nr:MarR family transcriptional regulator [Acidimicrobiia bacterium]MCY4651314.1 MarR family transcriptional regulator [bacterium]
MPNEPPDTAGTSPNRQGFAEGPHNLGAVTLLARLVQERLAVPLGKLGLTFAEAIAMVRLWRSPDGSLPQSDLIEQLVLSRASGSLVLSELEEAGFITRSIDPHDARRLLVSLTPQGEEIESKVHDAFEQLESHLFSPIGSDNWETVYDSLRSAVLTMIAERQQTG